MNCGSGQPALRLGCLGGHLSKTLKQTEETAWNLQIDPCYRIIQYLYKMEESHRELYINSHQLVVLDSTNLNMPSNDIPLVETLLSVLAVHPVVV